MLSAKEIFVILRNFCCFAENSIKLTKSINCSCSNKSDNEEYIENRHPNESISRVNVDFLAHLGYIVCKGLCMKR